MFQKKKVCIIYGGPSDEHEISLKSARNILKDFDTEKYFLIEVFLSKDLVFEFVGDRSQEKELQEKSAESIFDESGFFDYLKKENVDYVFPILHGKYGEDGAIQEKLENINIKYFGSDSTASYNAMNKSITNKIFEEAGISVPKTKVINQNNYKEEIKNYFNFPIILKPVSGGSSIGLYKFENEKEYFEIINKIFEEKITETEIKLKEGREFMLQEFIIGREFTCGVIDYKSETIALPITEVILEKDAIFDYDTKYTFGACKEITPAQVQENLGQDIKNLALKCHKTLGCKDMSRTDMMVNSKDNKLYVLEINTLPGMTSTSFIPAQLKEEGISMKDFLEYKILE